MAKHDSILRNKNHSKNKITFAKPKPKYLVNFLHFGQQDLWPWHTIIFPDPPIVQRRTLSPSQHASLTRVKIWCQHMPPNFEVKCPFYFEINLCHDYAAERSSHLCRLASRAGGEQKSHLCPSPFTSLSTQRESADSPFVFLPTRSSIKSRGKSHTGTPQPIHLLHLGLSIIPSAL